MSLTPATAPRQLLLLAWTEAGELVLSRLIEPQTLSLSGRDDSDVLVPALGDASVFVRATTAGGTLFLHAPGSTETKLALRLGIPVKAGTLTWLLGLADADAFAGALSDAADSLESPKEHQGLLADLIAWMARPMSGLSELRDGLRGFLSLLVEMTPATSGMLVLAEGSGFGLVSTHGLSTQEAATLWEKMPKTLSEDVLRTRARLVLPDELKRTVKGDSTVFVRGVRAVAGFPSLAEGRLVAMFYLGFPNLLKNLSDELQATLEAAADMLGIIVQRALLREQLEVLHSSSESPKSLPAGRLMVGGSAVLVDVYRLLGRLAPVDVATLITGETGTGKELAAKELHRLSPRAGKAFVVVNAAALPETLIESELFGHKKGAFTGALTDRVGLVEQAEGGTLFIDEIGELSLPMQAKLLRVLQEYAVTRIGETATRSVNFRLVTATHRNLAEMVDSGRFREDLFYRIAAATVRLPALREREGDIVTLATFFRQQFAKRHGLDDKEWSQEALRTLEAQVWSGNIRELENVVSRAFVMAESSVIKRSDLGLDASADQRAGATVVDTSDDDAFDASSLDQARDAWLRTYLTRALGRHNGHRADTARALGIGERTLFRYIEQLEIRDA